jgi:hypothetical protein
MGYSSVMHRFDGLTTPIALYDSTKTNLGTLIQQRTGATALDKFAGPIPVGLFRPVESSAAIPGKFPHVIPFSPTVDWVFLADNAAAAATRRVQLVEFDRSTSVFTFKGFITITFPTATNFTITGLRVDRTLHTDGTVAVSGTAVTGTSTTWQTDRCPVGCRIGFGSTDPTQISTWYEISAMASNTGITLTTSAGTISGGTPYVIEDLRVILAATNATATNGGLFVVKGLRYENFSNGGTGIAAAVSTDQVRACFWLKDASTVTNTVADGCAIEPQATKANQNVYVINGTSTTCRIFKYDVRKALTVSSGASTDGLVLQTGDQTLTGNIAANNNGRIASLSHGPGSGVQCLYWCTATRVYRAPLTSISAASTTFATDSMTEVPPGSTNTFAATGALASVEVASSIDRLILCSTGASGTRSYVTAYNTTGNQLDHIFLLDDKQIDQSAADVDAPPHPVILAGIFTVWSEGGMVYMCRTGTTAATNHMYAVPLGAHWSYASATSQRLIAPELPTPLATRFNCVAVLATTFLGDLQLGVPTEPYRIYYRTAGISDDSGAWTLIDATGDLSGVGAASSIQFMLEFRTIGGFCLPARIHKLVCVYDEGDDLPAELAIRLADSDDTNGTVGFIQLAVFGSPMPTLTIRYYRSDTNGLVLTQASSGTTNGEFQYWDGDSWEAGLGPDTIGTRRRFVPSAGLPSGTDVYVKIEAA